MADAPLACDGGYACPAAQHIEGCFTGEGDPHAVTGLYIGRLRAENERLREQYEALQRTWHKSIEALHLAVARPGDKDARP